MTPERQDPPTASDATATESRQAPPHSDENSPLDGWVQGMVRTQIELSQDPIRHYHASKHGF